MTPVSQERPEGRMPPSCHPERSEGSATHRFGSAVDAIRSLVDRFRSVGRRYVPRPEAGERSVEQVASWFEKVNGELTRAIGEAKTPTGRRTRWIWCWTDWPAIRRGARSSMRGDPRRSSSESCAEEIDPDADGFVRSPNEARGDLTSRNGHTMAAICRSTGNSVAGRHRPLSRRRDQQSAGASRRVDGADLPSDSGSVLLDQA